MKNKLTLLFGLVVISVLLWGLVVCALAGLIVAAALEYIMEKMQ